MRSYRGNYFLLPLPACLSFVTSATAASFSFSGTFDQDDEHRNFTVTISKPATVSVRTLSFGGGVSTAGPVVLPGGFGSHRLPPYSTATEQARRGQTVTCRVQRCVAGPGDSLLLGFAARHAASGRNLSGGAYRVWRISGRVQRFRRRFCTMAPEISRRPQQVRATDFGITRCTGEPEPEIVDFPERGFRHVSACVPHVTALVNSASNLAGQLAPNDALTYYAPGLPSRPLTVRITACQRGDSSTPVRARSTL